MSIHPITTHTPTAPSDKARALVLATDTRTNVARELLSGIVFAARRIEASLSEQAGRWVALHEVMAAEKAARPREYLNWAKSLVSDFDESQKQTFVRDLVRIKTLHAAAARLLPEKVSELHELIFHRPEEFQQSGQEIIIEIGDKLQQTSEADSKHGLLNWAAKNAKPEAPKRVRPVKKVSKEQREQAELEALLADLMGAVITCSLDKSIGLLARFAERDHAAFVKRRAEVCEALDGFKAKLRSIR